jgi:chromosome segregation ATPase
MTDDERDDIKRLLADTAAEISGHFDVVVERLEDKIGIVAEGHTVLAARLDTMSGELRGEMRALTTEVVALSGRMDRVETEVSSLRTEVSSLRSESEDFRDETRHEFSELRAMLKLSYAELDTRVTRLEATLAAVVSRLERLEKTKPS